MKIQTPEIADFTSSIHTHQTVDSGNTIGTWFIELNPCPAGTDLTAGNGEAWVYIPSYLNGLSLSRAQAMVAVAGTTNATTVQVRNLTKYPSNDALDAPISIASGETIGTPGSVGGGTYSSVSTDDQLHITVTGISSTAPKGLWVILEFKSGAKR